MVVDKFEETVESPTSIVLTLDPVDVLEATKLDPAVVDKFEATVESPTNVVLKFDPMTVLKEEMDS